MGQKTNPKAFRLVTTENHLSRWYSNKQLYSEILEDDYFVREKTVEIFEKFFVLSSLEIFRKNSESRDKQIVKIKLNALFPRSKEMYRKIISYFEGNDDPRVQKALNLLANKKVKLKPFVLYLLRCLSLDLISILQKRTNNIYYISFNFIKNPFQDATLIAKYISSQLEKRVPFRRVIKQCLRKVSLTSIKGIKVELSGRLNGIEIARSEWKRQGKIPLHTLRAKIDYIKHEAHTIYGVIGIKVWLFIK